MVYHKGVSQETFMSCPVHTGTHTCSTQKDNEGGKIAVCISMDTGFTQDIYSHKNLFPLYLSVHGRTFSSR